MVTKLIYRYLRKETKTLKQLLVSYSITSVKSDKIFRETYSNKQAICLN